MAVSEQTPYIEYTANGTATSFALEFDCDNRDHLIVLVDDVEPVAGAWSLSNGAVVFNTAPENGKKITLQRNTPFSRTTDYQSYNNSFRPPAVNKDFDWIWLKLQELGVADWILSNRINDLRAYVDKQDNVLQDNIDSLKNYVDDKDGELRNYLLNAIQEQGVALDQLEEYYNYLMQQLAQVAIGRGWAASFIVSADGSTQQQVNDRIGNTWYAKPLGYELNARVMLENGDIVKSTIDGNANNPNASMNGWLGSISGVVDSKAELESLVGTDGQTVLMSSWHKGLHKGGGFFKYDSTKASINNHGTTINGWVRQYTGLANIFMFGARGYTYENPNINDTVPIQRAIDTMRDIYIPEGMFKCNLVFTNSFNIRGAGKGSMLYPYDAAKPVMTNINRSSLGWNNDTVTDLEMRSLGFNDMNFTGTGFQFGLYPAQEGYEGVGRIVMRNVRIMGFEKGINKVNGNIGNKYYDCSFEYNKYHVYGKGNQLSLGNPNAALMHCGCDYFYGCNFSESTIAAVAYYDTSGGSGQWAFDNCAFQFNKGFAWFFEFDLPNGLDLFAPITSNNTWFESNASDTVVIDRLDGTTASMRSQVRSVIGANAVVMTVTDEFNTRFSVGVANPQNLLHIHDKETPTIQLTSDSSGNDSPNLGGVIYHNTQDFYLENKQTGIVYILSQNGRVELNASGDLTSNKGKIGYGYGAGNTVTQTGNKDTTVTCDYPSGRIITSAQSLGAGEMKTFILNNSYVGENDVLVANVRFSPSNSSKYYDIKVTNISNGSCQINIKNSNSVALGEAIEISFCIIAGTRYHN